MLLHLISWIYENAFGNAQILILCEKSLAFFPGLFDNSIYISTYLVKAINLRLCLEDLRFFILFPYIAFNGSLLDVGEGEPGKPNTNIFNKISETLQGKHEAQHASHYTIEFWNA